MRLGAGGFEKVKHLLRRCRGFERIDLMLQCNKVAGGPLRDASGLSSREPQLGSDRAGTGVMLAYFESRSLVSEAPTSWKASWMPDAVVVEKNPPVEPQYFKTEETGSPLVLTWMV